MISLIKKPLAESELLAMTLPGPKAPPGKFMVAYGIHRKTLMSRDSGMPTTHDSEPEARTAFVAAKQSYASMGYFTWFAYMYDDQGTRTELDRPVYCC